MKRKTTTLLLALGFIFSAQAAIQVIFVGQSGLTFSPSSVSVAVGDTVRFTWVSGSHTTTSVSVPSGAATWTSTMSANVTVFDYVVTTEGQYGYKCNPHAGAGMVGTFSATLTGINDKFAAIKSSIAIAPNPVLDQTTLSFNSDRSFKGSVKIYNATGDLVYDDKMKVEAGDNSYSLNLSKLGSGLYYVNLLDKNDSFLVQKLIKQ